jgi:hypothetical protein
MSFVIFHLHMCRFILIIILVPQVFKSPFKTMNSNQYYHFAIFCLSSGIFCWEMILKRMSEGKLKLSSSHDLQINVIVLAIILWGIGTEPSTHCSYLDISDFNHSFLLIPNSPILDETRQICRKCKFL